MFGNKFFLSVLLMVISYSILNAHLVEIIKLNPSIQLDIRYATKNNFVGEVVYPSARCYLEYKPAAALDLVQKELNQIGLGLKVFDGYRPLSVQKIFWEMLPDERYVANPDKGSKHNRGSAIDLTLIDLKTGEELKMPSDYDDLTSKAHRDYEKMEDKLVKFNCKLLELVMEKHGFKGLQTEWWHFDYKDWENYSVLDLAFTDLENK